MYVPAHLCAHTPYTCRNATYTGTLTTRMCTGPHRSPGSCWQGRLPGWGREPDWWGPPLREEPRASHWTRSPPLPSAICPCPCPRPHSEAGRENLTRASLPLPPPRPFSLRGTVESHPAPNPSWGLHSPPYAGHVPPRPPSPSQSSLRSDRAPWAAPRGCSWRRRWATWGLQEDAEKSPLLAEPPACAFALTLETVSSAVWLTTCSAVALKLSTLINHPGI